MFVCFEYSAALLRVQLELALICVWLIFGKTNTRSELSLSILVWVLQVVLRSEEFPYFGIMFVCMVVWRTITKYYFRLCHFLGLKEDFKYRSQSGLNIIVNRQTIDARLLCAIIVNKKPMSNFVLSKSGTLNMKVYLPVPKSMKCLIR